MPKPIRHRVIVDCESTGLRDDIDQAIEVAWYNVDTCESGHFIPPHDPEDVLQFAEPEALRINKYEERIPHLPQDIHFVEAGRLAMQLSGHTLCGSNPDFDAKMLKKLFGQKVWHHRMLDLSAYAMGVLGIDELLGLDKLCRMLQIGQYPDHSAAGDVEVTVLCFEKLWAIRAQMPQLVTA